MENISKLPTTAQPSLLSLNEYCLLDLFEFLKLEDALNLAVTCINLRAVADRIFRKYSTIGIHNPITKIGKERICRFFAHFGHHVVSLRIDWHWGPLDWKVLKDCRNLKRLKIAFLNECQNFSSLFRVDNLEVLALQCCTSKFTSSFLNIVYNPKVLRIDFCSIEANALTTVLRNSPDIESFSWCGQADFRLFEIIENVSNFCFYGDIENTSELDSLLKFERLTKLSLTFETNTNISSFLRQLTKKGIMQEYELFSVAVDEEFFEILTSFNTLQSLVLEEHNRLFELTLSTVWPRQLKYLRLEEFMLTFGSFLSTIKQLKYLERIDFQYCDIVEQDKDNFNDVVQRILCAIENSDRNQRLEVVCPWSLKFEESSAKHKCLIESDRLVVFKATTRYDPLQIGIDKWT